MSPGTAWVFLLIAGSLEIVWALMLQSTEGFTKFWPSVIVVFLLIASFYFLSQAVKGLPIGTAYAVWTGIGAAGTALIAIALGKEPVSMIRIACIFLILTGVTGLKFFAK